MPAKDQAAAVAPLADGLDAESVIDYLKHHPDFLQQHPQLLDYLEIDHPSGTAVSLVERQISVLRERNVDMRHRLNHLTANARDNDKIYDQTRELVLQIVSAETTAQLQQSFNRAMSRAFNVEHACMVLYSEAKGCRTESQDTVSSTIGALFSGKKAVCGALREAEFQFLFPAAKGAGSAAIVPIKMDSTLGFIAIGSDDGNRYHSDVGTVFLTHIADVIARVLPRLQTAQ